MIESLREVLNDEDKSGARILFAIFFWFIGYSAVETFFTLYAQEHLGIDAGDGATLLSVFPLFFVLFAIPSGVHRRAHRAARGDLVRLDPRCCDPGFVLYPACGHIAYAHLAICRWSASPSSKTARAC